MSASSTSTSPADLSPVASSCFFAYNYCNDKAVVSLSTGWANATTPTYGGIRASHDADLITSSSAQSRVTFAFEGEEGYFMGFTGQGYGQYQCSYDGGSTYESDTNVDSSSYDVASFCLKTGLSPSVTTTMVIRVVNGTIDLLNSGWYTGQVFTVTEGATQVQTLVASGKTVTLVESLPPTSAPTSAPTTSSSSGDIAGMSSSTFWVMMAVVGAGVVILVAFCVMTVTKKQEDTIVTYKKARVKEEDDDDDALGVGRRYQRRRRKRRTSGPSNRDPEKNLVDSTHMISPASEDELIK